jgi:hypothetical protein
VAALGKGTSLACLGWAGEKSDLFEHPVVNLMPTVIYRVFTRFTCIN